ncbi:MAG: glycosyltransferase family 4 protein [Candidatus Omnitrophica bacterium]|nr:glycosyltransferase family 4 protein [Candidatus Omnitrophota bacterium]
MRKINLLYVITKLELGGAQKQLLSLISRIDKEKFNVSLFTAHEGILVQEASAIADLTLAKSRYLERAVNPVKDFLALVEIFVFIKRKKIDIVHTHSSKAGVLGRLAARFARTRIILHTVHGWSFNDCQPALKKNFFICLERLIADFTDKLIVVSRSDMYRGLKLGIGSDKKYTLIRYGIDEPGSPPGEGNIKEELGISPDDRVVAMVACLKPQKSPQDFIRAASLTVREFPGVKFILAGDGILRRCTEDLLNKLNLKGKVILLGWRRDIPRILSIADVLVLTSLWEGLPIAALEGMSCGKPVIATDTGGIAEVIRDGETGFLVKPRDAKTISERLTALLRDEKLRKAIGQKAKVSLGADFSTGNMCNMTQNLYEALIIRQNYKDSAYVN